MIDGHFLGVLANYFGFPMIATIGFILVLLWLCRVFRSSAITNVTNETEMTNTPHRNRRLPRISSITLVLLLVPILCATQVEDPRVAYCTIEHYIKQLERALKLCFSKSARIEELCAQLLAEQKIEAMPLISKDIPLCMTTLDAAPIMLFFGFLTCILIGVTTFLNRRTTS